MELKKLLSVVVLGTLVGGLILPVLVYAQEMKAQACCQLKHDIKVGGRTFSKGAVIGKKNGICEKATLTGGVITVDCESGDVPAYAQCYVKEWGVICLLNTIYTATNWLFMIIMLIAVIMIVVGGFTYMTASGDPEKAGKGKTIIVYALIGIAIALFAKVIPSIIRFIMGV